MGHRLPHYQKPYSRVEVISNIPLNLPNLSSGEAISKA